jgi:hypothetical protein
VALMPSAINNGEGGSPLMSNITDRRETPGAQEVEPFGVWQSGEWTILHVRAGGVETTSSLTRAQAKLLSWKLRNSPRQAPEVPHWNGIGKYSPCISFDAGSLNINGGGFGDSDGSGCFVFRDDELDFEQEDGPLYRWINVSNSDLLHLRDKLNELFPPQALADSSQ